MKKKIVSTILSFLLVISAVGALGNAAFTKEANAAELTDIYGNWAQKEIEYFVDKGIITGYGDGTFLPGAPVTRAEFVTIVNKAFEFDHPALISFSDVKPESWYYDQVRLAVAAGFISGYADNTFRPNNNITREEVASIIQRILKLPAKTDYAHKEFNDVAANSHYNGAIGALTNAGIMKGASETQFSPRSNEKRDDTAYSLYNALAYGTGTNTAIDGNVIVREKSYGPSSDYSSENVSSVIVRSTSEETVVRNLVVQGDFTIEKGVETVYLQNVTVKGRLLVNGGSDLELEKCDIARMEVNNTYDNIKIDSSKDSICYDSYIYTSCTLTEEKDTLSRGFSNIVVNGNEDKRTTLGLYGSFVAVDIYADKTAVTLTGGQISDLYFYKSAEGSSAALSKNTVVSNADIRAEKVTISGDGALTSAKVDAANVKLNMIPGSLSGSYTPSYSNDVESSNFTITVVNRNGVPVQSAKVTLLGTTKTTNADGKASFTSVALGTHDYTVERSGFTTLDATLTVDDYTSSKTVTIASTGRYTLTFKVSDNSTGASLSSANIELKNVSSAGTTSGGSASFSNLDNGTYTFIVTKSGYSSTTDTITINGGNASRTVNLIPTAANYYVDFFVTDDLNLPVVGATVSVGSKSGETSGGSGNVRITGLAAGSNAYIITLDGYKTYTGTVNLPGKTRQDINLSLVSYTVTVNVKDGAEALSGAGVTLGGKITSSDESGTAVFTGVTPGTYKVNVQLKGYEDYPDEITVVDGNYTLGIKLTAK